MSLGTLKKYAAVVAAVGAVVAVKLASGPIFENDENALFLLAVVVALRVAGSRGGFVAIGLSALAQIYFFITPVFSFSVEYSHELFELGIWSIEGVIISYLFGAMDKSNKKALKSASEVTLKNTLLAESEKRLQLAHDGLEADIGVRTAELAHANASLREEGVAREKVEEALRESEEVHRMLFEGSPNPRIAFDAKTYRFEAVNEAALKMYGYSREEFLSLNLGAIREGGAPTDLADSIASPEPWSGIVRHRTKTGAIVSVQVVSALVRLRGRRVRLAAITDISERQKLEAQLLHSQKMDAVGQLAGGVAHDFNNMLNIMLGYTELLLDGMSPMDPAYSSLLEIKRAAERSAELTRQLLTFSRQQPQSIEVFDLNDVARGTEKLVRRVLGENIEIETHLRKHECKVKMDAGQLEQIIMNLAVNARDAMPSGGRLTIETDVVNLEQSLVGSNDAVIPGRYVMLAISDNGIGMDEATRVRIFEPFFTTKEQGKGTGLGLAIVFGIVQQSGGHVYVYSEPGKGTTFKVYFPVTNDMPRASSTEAHVSNAPGSETILLVEDEAQVRVLMEKVLNGWGYRVLSAKDPGEALVIAEKHLEHIDLLLTDVIMPKMTGRDLADRLLVTRPTTKVIYMSGYTDNVVLNHGVPEAFAFLQKPVSPKVLNRKIREMLDTATSLFPTKAN